MTPILGAVWGDLEIIMNDVFVGAFPIWVVVLDYILGGDVDAGGAVRHEPVSA